MNVFERLTSRKIVLFLIIWTLLFVLYLPAAKAGFVADFTGWMDQLVNHSFWEYINRTNFHVKSLYQFTQFTTYIFFRLFGAHRWPWHLLHITLQAINSVLFFTICKTIFDDSGIRHSAAIALGGIILFCICPHISEVIAWEPAFHYLQGFLIILIILHWVLQYLKSPDSRYAWWAAILYFLSTFSLEIFYLTPWFVLSLALYYRLALNYDRQLIKKTILVFFIPLIILFVIHLLTYRLVYKQWVAHIGTTVLTHRPISYLLRKPLEYIFHILFYGRFFPARLRQHVYTIIDAKPVILVFCILMAILCYIIIRRFQYMGNKGKAAVLMLVWTGLSIAIVSSLWLPIIQLLNGDRYTYLIDAFLYMLLCLLLSYISFRFLRIAIWLFIAGINLFFTITLSMYWKYSSHIVNSLVCDFPDADHKTVLLLSMPENMYGVPMIGAADYGEFILMHNLLAPKKANNVIYDVASFNLTSPNDGSHVNVLNDSTVRVTLNQWGTWWWRNTEGATSYETPDYKVNVIDQGHFYELTLKKPANNYLMLFEEGDQWRTVNWNRKNVDQY